MEQHQETRPYYKKSLNPNYYFRKYETQILLYSSAEYMLSKLKINTKYFDIKDAKQIHDKLITRKKT